MEAVQNEDRIVMDRTRTPLSFPVLPLCFSVISIIFIQIFVAINAWLFVSLLVVPIVFTLFLIPARVITSIDKNSITIIRKYIYGEKTRIIDIKKIKKIYIGTEPQVGTSIGYHYLLFSENENTGFIKTSRDYKVMLSGVTFSEIYRKIPNILGIPVNQKITPTHPLWAYILFFLIIIFGGAYFILSKYY